MELELAKLSGDAELLLSDVRNYFRNSKNTTLLELLKQLPVTAVETDKEITVVFAGQYSAGKSTIISLLTGHTDIKIGGGIVTAETTAFKWNGLEIIDTPGIHTDIHPDHDAITYEAIARADLVVFVITNELFDNHLSEHFRTLAFKRGKQREIMLVVNKMKREAEGNSENAMAVKNNSLLDTLAPATPNDFFTAYIDAESFLKAEGASTQERREKRLRDANMQSLIDNINLFTRERGLGGRYTTSLYTLEQIIFDAIGKESTGDADVDGTRELLARERKLICDCKRRTQEACSGRISRLEEAIRQQGADLANLVDTSTTENDFKNYVKEIQRNIEKEYEAAAIDIRNDLEEQTHAAGAQIKELFNGELAQMVLPKINAKFKDSALSKDAKKKLGIASDCSQKFGAWVAQNSINSNETLHGLQIFSGSNVHDAILKIGHFFGHKFKPWEALKWTKGLNTAAKALQGVGVILSVGMQIKDDIDQEKAAKQLHQARNDIRGGTLEIAQSISREFHAQVNDYVHQVFDTEISRVNQSLADLEELMSNKKQYFAAMNEFQTRSSLLIDRIHACK